MVLLAIATSGMLHICHNISDVLSKKLTHYKQWVAQAKAVQKFMRPRGDIETFIERRRRPDGSEQMQKLKRAKFSMLDHRWLSSIKCAYEQLEQEDSNN